MVLLYGLVSPLSSIKMQENNIYNGTLDKISSRQDNIMNQYLCKSEENIYLIFSNNITMRRRLFI
jgi:hypothetical protein